MFLSLLGFSTTEQRFLCGVFVGRFMLHCGVFMTFLFDEKRKTKYLWPPCIFEVFMVLLQTFSIELQYGVSQWGVRDVACEFIWCRNVAGESSNILCCILVLNSVPQPNWKHMSFSTVGMRVVMDSFYKLLFCGSSLATPFTSRYQIMNLLCTTLLVSEQEYELAIDWNLLWRYSVSHNVISRDTITGKTVGYWSLPQKISRETKLLSLSIESRFSAFTWENRVAVSPKSGQEYKIKTSAR